MYLWLFKSLSWKKIIIWLFSCKIIYSFNSGFENVVFILLAIQYELKGQSLSQIVVHSCCYNVFININHPSGHVSVRLTKLNCLTVPSVLQWNCIQFVLWSPELQSIINDKNLNRGKKNLQPIFKTVSTTKSHIPKLSSRASPVISYTRATQILLFSEVYR